MHSFCAGFLCVILLSAVPAAADLWDKETYPFKEDPIDVVIPCVGKDAATLNLCIEGIKKNGKNIRRVIVVSPVRLTERAEWFDQKNYPFTKYDVGLAIFRGDRDKAAWFESKCPRAGWIYQQLLKLYAPLTIPEISSNVLILDADAVFLKPVEFLGPLGGGLYNPGTDWWSPYFQHMEALLPGFCRYYRQHSGIAHHMLFQRCVIEDLFRAIESQHGCEPWKALCRCINISYIEHSCISEYEIYFNYVFRKTDQVALRPLKWGEGRDFSERALSNYTSNNFDYAVFHSWLRGQL